MTLGFAASDLALIGVQAGLVALPAAGAPGWARRLGGRWWALVLPVSLGAVVAGIAASSSVADGLALLAALAVPPLAAAALGWGMRDARPRLALLAAPLLAIAWWRGGTLAGEACAVALTALSCVTLGRLLAGIAPLAWLKAGIVAMAALDAILVFGSTLQAPNATLNAAAAPGGYPPLQSAAFGDAVLGYGDLFVAAVLGAIVAVEGGRRKRVALAVLGAAVVFDLLFLVRDELPATVPVAVVVLAREWLRRHAAAAPGAAMPAGAAVRENPRRPGSSAVRAADS